MLAACAVVEPPPGGPIDEDPPFITFVFPDSGSTGLGQITKLQVAFSEKMDRQPATAWLHFFPDQRIRKTKWKGAMVAEIELEEPLPADTLIVVEVTAGMRDAHKVMSKSGRRYPLATAGEIPAGSLAGILLLEEEPLTNGVVELYPLQPDTLEYFQRPLARRTYTDDKGAYRFDWLPVPGGPWVARAFGSRDGSLRPGERDPQRVIPDTLQLTIEEPAQMAGLTTLYKFDTPGRLLTGPFAPGPYPGRVMAFTRAISDADTGYVARPLGKGQADFSILDPDSGGVVEPVPPGSIRLIAFVDVDADSAFSVVPDTIFGSEVASRSDTVIWYLEPWTLAEGLAVKPGLDSDFIMPLWTDSLTVGIPPLILTAPDSLSGAFTDSLNTAWADSLRALLPDSLQADTSSDPE